MQSVKGDRLDSAAAFVCIFSRLLVFARLIRPLKWGFLQILARIALIASVLGLAAVSANSFELPTTPAGSWTASGTITTGTGGGGSFPLASGTYFKTTPSGLRMTVTVDGVFSGGVPSGTSGSYFANPANTNTTSLNPSAAGTNPGPFTTNPVLPASTNGIVLETEFNPCTVSGPTSTTCTGLGTVTVTFTDPLGNPVRVVNPKIHVTRFGGTVGSMELTTGLQLNAALSTPGLTLGPTSPAAQTATLNTTLSNEFFGDVAAPGVNTNVNCNATATSSAGCGSIQVTGSPSTMVFNVKGYRTTIPPNSWSNGGDAYMFDVTFDEDFGGAPNTYEGGGTAAAHLISDLKLGGAVTAENVTTSNGDGTGAGLITVDPNAVVAPAAPGDTNDGVASFPALLTSNIGSTYTVTPTISGASRAGKICGWLDFDRSGTFSAAEGVCNTFASGATSAPLTWTVPTATTAGPTYARVRVTYDTNMSTASFNGLFSSGEVEDYLVQIKPAVKVVKALVPAADTGTFNLQIGGTTFATAVGNNGTTGFKSVYHTDTPDVTVATNVSTAPVTGVAIAETAAGATVLANYATTSACTNAAGTAVTVGGTASAPTVTIPQSVTGASANGQAQTITCTLTNSKKPIVTVTKISNGGVGTFNFSGTNGIGAHAITTATSGVGVSGTPQVLTNLGTVTRITETVPTGFSLTNIACTGTGAGNTTNNLAGGFVDLAVGAIVAGANINCTFTNTAWPKLTLTKTVVTTGGGVATVANFPLTATGPVTITGTSGAPAITSATVNPGVYALSETPLADYTAGAWSCTGGTLAGSNLTLAAGDVASCSITNTFVPNPKLTVAKTAGTPTTALGAVTTATDALDTITFTYVVNNTGNVPMTNVVPVDAGPKFNGIAGTNALGAFSPASATIAVGGSQAFTATYVLSQTDVNNAAGITGGVTNSATVTGKDPSGGTFTSPSSTASTTISKTSALTTAKTAGTPTTALGAIATATDAGDTITYTYAVTNTGNVSLTNVVPSDAGPKFNGIAGTGTLGAFSPASATIAPGVTQNFTAVYTLAQTDVNNAAGITNAVTNSATASGKQPDGTTTTSPAGTATATIGKTSTLTTSKSAGAPTVANGVQATLTDGGDKITYSYTVTNTGNVTLTNVVPADAGPKFNGITGTGSLGAFAPTSATLTPGGSVIFTATYTLSQADVNNAAGLTNAVTNSATSSGKQPDGTTTTSAAATATATIAKTASLTTLKSAASPTIALGAVTSATDALDTITFTYAVTNTGNVALSNVIPADAGPKFNGIAGTGTLGAFSPAATILQPGATQNFTAVYTLTQTDVNNAAGITNGVTNTATASGKQPDGSTTTSPSSSASTTINKTSSLSLSKSAAAPTVSAGASATVTDVGDSITYSYTVTNTGNVTLTNVVPSDAGPKFNGIAGTGTLGAYAPASATLAPGNSVIFTAVYPLTQTDINNGAGISSGVTNTASASGKQPDGTTTTSPSASATATILESSSLTLVKTAAAPTVAAGANATATDGLDTITFSYTVKNTGNVSLTNVTPVDSGPTFNGNAGTGSLGAFSPASASLAPGAQQIFTATYTLSQGDVNNAAGVTNGVANTATAKGTKPSGATTTSPSSTANATISKTSALTLVKTSSSPSLASGANAAITDAGDTITYSYTVNNTGNVTLFSVVPSDSGPTFNGSAAGATLSAYSPASATILPGASQVFTATYTLTQTDIDHAAGVTNGVTNSATASGTQPGGATTVSNSSTGQTTIPASSSLTLTKAAGVPTVALGTNPTQTGASDTITYTYTVKNTGNVTLTGVVPADTGPTFNGAAKAGTLGAFSPASATLAPGATQVFTAVYTLAQADMNSAAGITNGVSNTATASGLQPGGATTTTAPSTAKTTIPETSSLALTKAAGAPSVALGTVSTLTDGGDKITYTYTVRNTGNVTLTNVAPTDVGPSFNGTPGTGSLGAFSPASATLAPGASAIFTAVYTMSQGDVNNAAGITNGVTNTASAIGTKPSGSTVTAPNATAQATIAASSNLSLTKSAGVPTTNLGTLATKTDGGDTITYSYTVRNSGNVTLTGVKPVDAGPTFNGNAATGALGAFVPATATLAPGATQVFTATYTLSQSDVDNAAGVTNAVSNTATAVGTQPGGATTTSPSATAKATIGNGPALTVTKVADKASVSALPATITYTITLANTGNVTLSAVNLTDALTQGGALTLTSGPTLSSGDGNSNSKIDINETWTYTATYVLTQAEMNNGANIVNTATVSTAQTAAQTATATTTISQTSSMSLLKNVVSVTTSNGANATETDAADVITYSYLVTNTGNTTLTNVAPADPGPTFNGHAAGSSLSAFTPAPVSLAPGASQAFTATYILAQADVNNAAGITNGVSNTATTSGKKPDGSSIASPSSTATTTIANASAITLVKSGTLNTGPDGRADAGDTISYSFTIKNTGNTTLTNITVTDAVSGVTVSGGPITLAPGAQDATSITATYVLTQADIDAGTFANTATVNGKDPQNNTVSATNGTTVPLAKTPSLAIDKTTTSSSYSVVGDNIFYNYAITNTGNTTITSPISVSDNKIVTPNTVSCDPWPGAGLAPAAVYHCSATYVVTQADIDAGSVVNIASASDGTTTSPSDTVTVPAVKTPAISMVKTPVTVNFTVPGDTVSYDYVVTNTGNTTITTPVTVTDNFIPSVSCPTAVSIPPWPAAGLLPGASVTCHGSYTVTQDDLDIGSVVNIATATDGTISTPPASATVPANANPGITLVKTANDASFATLGQVVSYTYDIQNTGNVTLTKPIDITDDQIGTFNCFTGNLTPTSHVTCVHNYTITQADLDRGSVTNVAFGKTTYGVLVPPTPVTSPTATQTIPADPTVVPGLSLTKSSAPAIASVGQTITYTLTVKNTGKKTLSNVNITDPLIPSLSCTIASMLPGVSDSSCQGNYVVTQADFDAGHVVNTGHASAIDPQGNPVTADDTLVNPTPAAAPALQLTKTPSVATFDAPGQVIGYVFAVKNTGNVTLHNVVVTDPLIPSLSCTIASLAPGATNSTCSATYTTTLADVNAGSRNNTATAQGTDPFGTNVNTTGNASVPATQTPQLTLTKTGTLNAGPDGRADVGDTISYTFTVKNTGNVTLTNVSVSDPLVTVTGAAISLLPGATDTTTFTGIYVLTQADINAGVRPNTATTTGTLPDNVTTVSDAADATTPLPADPKLALTKTGTINDSNSSGVTDAGDTIIYVFTVKNTGNVTLTNVLVTDPLVTVSGAAIPSLAPGATDTTQFTATYVLTQADIDAGVRANTASVAGTPPTGPPVSASATETKTLPSTPDITIAKAGTLQDGGDGRADVGDTITYAFTVKNTGNVTLSNVTVSDPVVTVAGGPVLSLAPGATDSTTFTATYTLTQADIDAANVHNVATVKGTPPIGADVSNTGAADTPLPSNPAVSLIKNSVLNDGGDGRADAGDTITYAFTVTNTGNVTLTNLTVADPLVTVTGGPIASLAPGAVDSSTFTATYTLTQADVNAGQVLNTATAKGTPPTGADVTGPASKTTVLPADPALSIVKAGVLNAGVNGVADAGDTITYSFTVQNTGNVTLTAVTVTDPLVTVAGTAVTLLPGETSTGHFTGTYTLTQADVNAGQVPNTATVTGKPPVGPDVTSNGSATTPLPANPALTLAKTGTLHDGGDGIVNVGDTISYVLTVTNPGNVTLTNVKVADPLLPSLSSNPACTIASFAPGATDSGCTGTYTLTQADIDAGSVVNVATANGTPPTGPDLSAPATANTPLAATPAMTLTKAGTLNAGPDGHADAGDTITYAFTVKNTGNVTLTNVTVSDPVATVTGGPIATLAVGATDTTTFTAVHTLTQAEIDTGSFSNTATVAGNPPTGPPVTAPGSNTTPLGGVPGLQLTKSATVVTGPDGVADAGDVIAYSFTVKNTGNVTLSNVVITDPSATVSGGPLASLAPGVTDATTFTATHTLTQADIDSGSFANTAGALGNPPTGPPVTTTATATAPLSSAPAVLLTKTGTLVDGGDGIANAGDTVTYTFTVKNTGNVTLTNVTVTDPTATMTGGPIASLAPGASDTTTFTAHYTLTVADINAGQVSNTATADGTPPTGPHATNDDTAIVPLPSVPSISLLKTGTLNDGGDGMANAGDTVTYAFTVSNTGNVTLTDVAITDPKVTVTGGPLASLAPGATDTTTFTATYTLTAADVNSGAIVNTASVAGTPPTGADVTAPSTSNIPLAAHPSLALVKTGVLDPGPDGRADAGDVINYAFTVTNTGNVTLTNVTLADPGAVISGGPIASLAGGASDTTTFTASHILTAAEVAAGTYANTATVNGTPPTGPDVSAPGSTSVALPAAPAITLVKAGTLNDGGDGVANIGDTITYAFTVTNTGNVPLTGITVSDPLIGAVSGGPITLAAGAVDTATFTATYTVTAADVDAGTVNNTATVKGTPPTGADVTGPGSTSTPLAAAPAMTLAKSGTLNDGGDGVANVGDTITYAFTVKNTGNVTLSNVTVTDPKVTVTGGPITLAAGATDATTFTAVYTLTAADIDAGTFDNTATVTGKPPSGPDVSATGNATTPLSAAPAMTLAKAGTLNDGGDGVANAGDTITYAFTVANTGNVTLTNVTVTDAKVTVSGGPIASLPAGASDNTTFTATYTLTAADIDAGKVDNSALVTGTPPSGPNVTAPGITSTLLPAAPAITLTKTGTLNDGGDGAANAGDTITYAFTVANTGNVTLTNVTVTDPKVTVSGGPIASLAAGASNAATFTATYTLTAADIDAGKADGRRLGAAVRRRYRRRIVAAKRPDADPRGIALGESDHGCTGIHHKADVAAVDTRIGLKVSAVILRQRYAASVGDRRRLNGWGAADRCSRFSAPPTVTGAMAEGAWKAKEYWHGNMLYIPGGGEKEILLRLPGGWTGPQALPDGNHPAGTPDAELVCAERPGDGRGAVRDRLASRIRPPEPG